MRLQKSEANALGDIAFNVSCSLSKLNKNAFALSQTMPKKRMKSKILLKMAAVFLAMVFFNVCPAQEKPVGVWVSQSTRQAILFKEDGRFVIMHASRSRRARKAYRRGDAIKIRTSKQACGKQIWVPVQEGKY